MSKKTDVARKNSYDIKLIKLSEINKQFSISACQVQHGEIINVGGLMYEVNSLEEYQASTQNSNREFRKSVQAFDLMKEEGIIHHTAQLQDICLRNTTNGTVLLSIKPPKNTDFFNKDQAYLLRFNANMLNVSLHQKYKIIPNIDIKFSPCLFGTHAAYLLTEDGQKIPVTDRRSGTDKKVTKIVVPDNLYSFYEEEILTRMFGTIYFLSRTNKNIKLTSTLPKAPYYTFVFEDYENGIISKEIVLEWFGKVDKKVATITDRIERFVSKYVPSCVQLSNYSFLDAACDLMYNYTLNSNNFNSKELLLLIYEKLMQDSAFANFVFTKIPFPENFKELADLSYVLSNLNDMSENFDYEKRQLNILIYDITENKLLDKVRQMRNMKFLNTMNLFNPSLNKIQPMDHLSYIGVMTTENIVYELSDEFIEEEMYGFKKLYGMNEDLLSADLQKEILRNLTHSK